ncbi:MAG: hypothetical protein ACK4MV_16305 [Beijerinckiaceae bacterium]
MLRAAPIPPSRRKPTRGFFVVILAHDPAPYAVEQDFVSADPDDQWREIVSFVWSGEWEDVIACYYVRPIDRTCDDYLIPLAHAVDALSRERNEDPHSDVREWIESITGDDAFMTDATRERIRREQAIDYAIDIARGK